MNDGDFEDWSAKAGLTRRAIEVIKRIRESPPGRPVRTGTRNSLVRFPSHKMAQVIACESATVEYAFVLGMEHDDDVLEFHPQPAVRIKHSHGVDASARAYLGTADMFVIRRGGAAWEEYKTESDLNRLADANSDRYSRDATGQWRSPSAERFAGDNGLEFVVRSDAELPRRRLRNIEFLQDYLREPDGLVASERVRSIVALVRQAIGTTLAELLDAAGTDAAADIYRLIVQRRLYVDLDRDALGEPSRARVFVDRAASAAFATRTDHLSATGLDVKPVRLVPGAGIEWDGIPWTIVNAGDKLTLRDSRGQLLALERAGLEQLVRAGNVRAVDETGSGALSEEASAIYRSASPEALERANRRLEAVRSYLAGNRPATGATPRAVHDWVRHFRAAEQTYGWGYLGLIERPRPGNTLSRLEPQVEQLIEDAIARYASNRQTSVVAEYAGLAAECERLGLTPPSRQLLGARIRDRKDASMTLARQGRKAAYQADLWHWDLNVDTPRHGDRPFQIAHIDHTECDIELLDPVTGRPLGRPWLTLVIDAFTRRCLAAWLSFDPPSYRSVMAALRLVVRRWSRLPDTLIVDGGSEFHGTYLETLAGLYDVSLRHRPKSAARHGSVIERLFGTANTEFFHLLAGNTQATKNVRQLTPEMDPRRLAAWDLESLYEALCAFLYEIYDARPHPAIHLSPREAAMRGNELAGQRPARLVAYDETFLLATMPGPAKGFATIDAARGIKLGALHYWAPALSQARLKGQMVRVRYDPWDIRSVRVYVGGEWIDAPTKYAPIDEAVSERELMIAAQELKPRGRATAAARRRYEADLIAAINHAPIGQRANQRAADIASRQILALSEGRPSDMRRDVPGHEASVGSAASLPADQRKSEIEPEASVTPPPDSPLARWYKPGQKFGDYA